MSFVSEKIYLRLPQPGDLELLHLWENDPEVWKVSEAEGRYTRAEIDEFIRNASADIFETGQLRFMIVLRDDDTPVGTIDLFGFDPQHRRAGVGILIYDHAHRAKGYASQALELVTGYSFDVLKMHQLHCDIPPENTASIALFRKHGFEPIGLKKEWTLVQGQWQDQLMFQLLAP